MKIITFKDPNLFLARAQPFLERSEVLNSLILGINIRLAEHPEWTDIAPYQAVVEDTDGSVILAASVTPPQNLLLAGDASLPQAALDLLAANLLAGGWKFPALTAEKTLAERMAAVWSGLAGQVSHLNVRLRAYELRQVIPPPNPAPGYLRLAREADLDLIARWREVFERESLNREPGPNMRKNVQRNIEAGHVFLWEDGEPVSTAIKNRPTPRGISIGAVYTPPEKRGRGYASTCVASISQRMLDEGKEFCALFTNLDYPTSNAIYQKIGYRMVGDFLEIGFENR